MKLCWIGGDNEIDNFYGLVQLTGGENQIWIQVEDSNLVSFKFDDIVMKLIMLLLRE